MATYINILDLKSILLWGFAGSTTIFTFIALILMATLAGRFRMPSVVFLALVVLFTIMMSSYVGGIYLIVLLLVGLIGGYLVGRTFNR